MFIEMRKRTLSKCFAGGCAALLCGGLGIQSAALENASFENPVIGPLDLTNIDLTLPPDQLRQAIGFQLTETSIPGWVQTGDVFGDTGGVISDTGIFSNQDVPQLGVFGIEELDGMQLGFLVVNTLADGSNQDFVSIYQGTGSSFVAGQDYSFSLEVGESVTLSSSERTPLRMSIGYLDDTPGLTGSDIFKPVANRDITRDLLDTTGSGALTDFTVELLADDIDAALLGKPIAVQALVAIPDDLTESELTNIQGAYNVDNARFVPEPTSLAMLAAGGWLLMRRRR